MSEDLSSIIVEARAINGKEIPAVTSLRVAEHFGKNHKDVLRDIRVTIEKCSQEFNERNFAPVEYTDAKGEKRPMYLLSKDGFMMVAMAYTTPEAMRIKEAYIARFNEMEQDLRVVAEKRVDIRDILGAAQLILEAAKIPANHVAIGMDNVWQVQTGTPSLLKQSGIALPEPAQMVRLTPTQIGKELGGVSARTVNKMLAHLGLQERVCDAWQPTEEGRKYGVLLDTGKAHSNGTAVTQLKWYPTVLELLKK